ncbi:MAG TPA: DinB family protein [Candidatus Limnocylindrales bacterium]|nr:DinB family protein [Candidatus Limnocylindrales bacterium]
MSAVASSARTAFPSWPDQNRRLRERVGAMTNGQLARKPAPDRWPLWASIGHLACQRVWGLCDIAGAPGAAESPFPNAGWHCPGDDDLEHFWSRDQLLDALDRTFAIVEWCLDNWTFESLAEVVAHPEWDDDLTRPRGVTLQRSYAHDIWHVAELNDALGSLGLEQIAFWD